MKPDIWGPAMWNFLFDIAHFYRGTPDADTRTSLEIFFEYLQYILPCAECRKHSRIFYAMNCSIPRCGEDYGLYMLYPLKNAVNRRLGKEELSIITYLERRVTMPLTGSSLTLFFICKILWTLEVSRDITIDQDKAHRWCTEAHKLATRIPSYGASTWEFQKTSNLAPIVRIDYSPDPLHSDDHIQSSSISTSSVSVHSKT